jgi:cation diffusion facilitator family transporter
MDQRYEVGQKVAVIGIAANLCLLAGKLTVGFLFKSQAMMADGFNSFGDVLASLITLVGSHVAGKPADYDHPYGHGKAEYLSSAVIGLLIFSVGFYTLRSSVYSIIQHEGFIYNPLLPVVAAATILVKGTLYFVTSAMGKKFNSLIILANSEDHRNDMFLSAGMLIGICGGLAGVIWLDGVVGILISMWLIYTGVRLIRASASVLMDTVIDPKVVQHLREHILCNKGVSHIDSIQSKPVGSRYILIVKVSVPGGMTVSESHKIAGVIREELKNHREIADVVVHINPDTPHEVSENSEEPQE